jgi:signal transduction histidine kinase
VLLRRIILLVLISVLLSGTLSAGIYILVSRQMYVYMRADELTPIARTVAEMIAEAQENGWQDFGGRGVLPLLDRGNRSFLGAAMHIYNKAGESIMNPPDEHAPPGEPQMNQMLQNDLNAALSGKETAGVRRMDGDVSFIVVGVPIASGGETIGAVLFTKPVSELDDTRKALNLTLIVSTFAAFAIMLIPGYFAAKRIVVPIRQMREVAHAMAAGDFTGRADETQRDELGELGRAMNRFAMESERLEQTRRDYVANVSHELRTPVAALRAMGETLRDDMAKTPEKREMFYNNIVRESLRLSRLIDDLLELSRLQSGAEEMQKRTFDLREILRRLADAYGNSAAEAEIAFSATFDSEEPILVCGNPDRVEQALVILLDNATKHTPGGGEIALIAENKGVCVEVGVTNSVEIPGEDLPHIFERFYTADKSHSGDGFGLGLSIAQEIMSRLGERLSVESGGGETRFSFTVSKDGSKRQPPCGADVEKGFEGTMDFETKSIG